LTEEKSNIKCISISTLGISSGQKIQNLEKKPRPGKINA
jgi:hypothetical protein